MVLPASTSRCRRGGARFALAFVLSACAHVAVLGWFLSAGPAPAAPAIPNLVVELTRFTPAEAPRDAAIEQAAPRPPIAPVRPRRESVAPAAVRSEHSAETVIASDAAREPAAAAEPVVVASASPAPPAPDDLNSALALQVASQLEHYKFYPRAARRDRIEGTALLRFSLDRDGRLLARELVTSSGHAILDRAALDLLARAAPYPALPHDAALERIELTLPVDYRLVAAVDRG